MEVNFFIKINFFCQLLFFLLLMSVSSKPFFSFMLGYLFSFSFFAACHFIIPV